MARFLLSVERVEPHGRSHVRLRPGINLSAFGDCPALGRLAVGAVLELRHLNGARVQTQLLQIRSTAMSVEEDKVATEVGEPQLFLLIRCDGLDYPVVPGTDVWWVEEPAQ